MKVQRCLIEKGIIILICILLFPILIEAFYNHPTADDYWYSALTHDVWVNGGNLLDVFGAAINTSVNFMNSWQGLYSSAFVLALQPGIFTKTENMYFITTWILVFLIVISIILFVRELYAYFETGNKLHCLSLGFILAFFIIETIPDPNQGLFWYNGAMNYTLFWTLLVISIALMINCSRTEKNALAKYILLVILGLFIGGGNHLTAVVQIIFAVIFLLFSKKNKRHICWKWLYCLMTIVGLVINLTAKGTQLRRESLAYHGNIIKSILLSIIEANRRINGWIGISLILLCLLCFMLCRKDLEVLKSKNVFKWIYVPVGVILSYGLVCVMLCIPYYAMGTWGDGRLINIIYATFVILFVLNFLYFVGCIQDSIKGSVSNVLKIFIVFGAILYIGVFGNVVLNSSTSLHAILSLCDGSAKQYDSELDYRIMLIEESDKKNIEVPKLSDYPHNLFFQDIDYDENNYKNIWTATYFHKDSIKIVETMKTE